MTAEAYPADGTRITVSILEGYKLSQNRPMECRTAGTDPRTGKWTFGCKCGTCNGVTREAEGTVERTVFWADNSIETFVALDEGGRHIIRHKMPSGDLCF